MNCPVCESPTTYFARTDANRTCEDHKGQPVFAPANRDVVYVRCNGCALIFCPEMLAWSRDEYAARIYNDEYAKADPDYLVARPRGNAGLLRGLLAPRPLRHLDYGGGNGMLARLMREAGCDSTSYDSFVDEAAPEGPFDLITAFEVMEHVPDPRAMMRTIEALSGPATVFMFSTLLADDVAFEWWYMAPRNGHVMLYTSTALKRLFTSLGWRVLSVSPLLHFAFRQVPAWLHVMR